MSYYLINCRCKRYVEADPCSGTPAPGMRVFVHEDDLPLVATVFVYPDAPPPDGKCWSIDPSGPRVCLPQGAHRVRPGADYTSCQQCEDRTEEQPPGSKGGEGRGGGSGGSGGGGGGPGGGGGGDGGIGTPVDPDPGEDCWKQASPCPGHEGRGHAGGVYVPCDEAEEGGGRIFNMSGTCYSVGAGSSQSDSVPTGGRAVSVSGSFDNCNDCTKAIQAVLCPDQPAPPEPPEAPSPPDVWVSIRHLPPGPVTFTFGGYCYTLDPTQLPGVPPQGAIVLGRVQGDRPNCGACAGVKAILCPDYPPYDREVWVAQEDLPSSAVVFRHAGRCWSINPATPLALITGGAELVIPVNVFGSCIECRCAPEPADQGVRAQPCPSGAGSPPAEDVWVREQDIPAERWVWFEAGVCYSVSPSMTLQPIPVGAKVVRPRFQFQSCEGCTTIVGGGGHVRVPQPPPLPPPPSIPYGELRTCNGNEPTGKWVNANLYPVGTVLKPAVPHIPGRNCYKVSEPLKPEEEIKASILQGSPGTVWGTCTNCESQDCTGCAFGESLVVGFTYQRFSCKSEEGPPDEEGEPQISCVRDDGEMNGQANGPITLTKAGEDCVYTGTAPVIGVGEGGADSTLFISFELDPDATAAHRHANPGSKACVYLVTFIDDIWDGTLQCCPGTFHARTATSPVGAYPNGEETNCSWCEGLAFCCGGPFGSGGLAVKTTNVSISLP